MKRILVIGKEGQIGWELERVLSTLGQVTAWNRSQGNLNDLDSLTSAIRMLEPHVIINAAAYTAVDRAEEEWELAEMINSKAPGVIAEEAKRLDALFIHYSTDYVFNGKSSRPYVEEDLPDPANRYGRTKWNGEKAIQSVGGKYLIIRTSWVYSSRGNNFVLTMLKLARERERLSIVNDQIGSPTWSRLIAQATGQVLLRPFNASGLYHLTSGESVSWHGFAEAIFSYCALLWPEFKPPIIKEISSREYQTLAKRPAYSVLSNEKFFHEFAFQLPSWKVGLHLCLNEFASGKDFVTRFTTESVRSPARL